MPLRGFIAAFVLGVLGSQARAADPVAYAEAFDTLYSVDLATHQASEIGRATPLESQFRYANIVGLTFSPAGVLYAVSDAGAIKTLLTINRGTGLATAVGTLDLGTDQQLDLGLAFTCDGQLWMSSGTGDFWSVDPLSAIVTPLGNLGVTVTGLAGRGTSLYATGSQGNNNLYAIDRVHATARLIGGYRSGNYITTMSPGFDATGKLWAVLDYVPPPSGQSPDWSDLAQVHVSSGVLTNLGSITPSQAKWAGDLQQIGLKGLAIPAAVCAGTATVSSTPALSWRALALLIGLFMLVGGTVLRSRRQSG
jgi:hypothetical protein